MKKLFFASAALLLLGAGCYGSQPVPQPPVQQPPVQQPPVQAPITEDPNKGPTAKAGVIVVDALKPGDIVASPLTITGKAKGWYFEASFPVEVLDANGKVLAIGPAQAQSDWMTSEFVPFKITLTFAPPATATGTIVFRKDNPSGLPQHDDEMRLPVRFAVQQ